MDPTRAAMLSHTARSGNPGVGEGKGWWTSLGERERSVLRGGGVRWCLRRRFGLVLLVLVGWVIFLGRGFRGGRRRGGDGFLWS